MSFMDLATEGFGSNLYLYNLGIKRFDKDEFSKSNLSRLDFDIILPNPKAIPFLEDHNAELLAKDMNL